MTAGFEAWVDRWRSALSMDRRLFLRLAAAGGGLLISARPLDLEGLTPARDAAFLNAYVRIDPDDTVTIRAPCPEVGQGVRTALPMIVAGELGADWRRCRFEQAPADDAFGGMTVAGSDSVADYWLPLRQAASLARAVLVRAAATAWAVPEAECTVVDGVIAHEATGRRSRFGALASAAAEVPIPADVPLRPLPEIGPVGTPTGPVDARDIVMGRAEYGLDVRFPEMVVATLVRPPAPGFVVEAVRAEAARAHPGVLEVVRVPGLTIGGLKYGSVRGGVAIIGADTWAALRGRELVEIEWGRGEDDPDTAPLDTEAARLLTEGPRTTLRGPGASQARGAGWTIEAEYALPMLAHVCMEPVGFGADVGPDRAVLRGATQNPRTLQAVVAALLRLPLERVEVHPTLSGGGFGRRLAYDYGVEAAWLSREIGRPVQVIWTREDDLRHDYYRPPSWHRLRARLDSDSVLAWSHHLVTGSLNRHTFDRLDDPPAIYDVQGGADMPYSVPEVSFDYSEIDVPLQLGSWRSVSHSFNVFAVESFLDEVAQALGRDPLDLRLALLPDSEPVSITLPLPGRRGRPAPDTRLLRRVLLAAAEGADWPSTLQPGWGRGIACCYYKQTYCAHVAEVDASGSQPRVRRVVVAVDCGVVVNPDGAIAQCEGAVMDAITSFLLSGITVENGRVVEGNFDTYPIARMADAPTVRVLLLPSNRSPSGMGEPPYPSAVPAIANAWYAATGTRVRSLPLRKHAEDRQ